MGNKKSTNKNDVKTNKSSGVEDCADVTSRYERFKKKKHKSIFPPVNYEKPPHY